jgi:hypothetical protein
MNEGQLTNPQKKKNSTKQQISFFDFSSFWLIFLFLLLFGSG